MILIKSLKDSYRSIIVSINKKRLISNFVLLVLISTSSVASCDLRNDDRQGSALVDLKTPLAYWFLVLVLKNHK